MLLALRTKNFKSLINFEADLRSVSKPVKTILVYGENGSGKTNFLSAIQAITSQISSMQFFHHLSENIDIDKKSIMKSNLTIKGLLSNHLTIGKEKGMIEIDFLINNIEGTYTIEFDTNGLISEKLYYLINNNRGYLFEINLNGKEIERNISRNIIAERKFSDDLNFKIDQYWGRHSFMSIVNELIHTSNPEFVKNNVNVNFTNVLHYFSNFFIKKLRHEEQGVIRNAGIIENFVVNPLKGTIEDTEMNRESLDKLGEIIFLYLQPLLSEIIDVKYQTKINDKNLDYKLIIVKEINNELFDVPIENESSGTINLINLLPYISEYLRGNVVIIDEIETAVHDLLIREMVNSLVEFKEGNGQIIATTHNTAIMESIDDSNLFILSETSKGKTLNSIKSYQTPRNRSFNNIRKRYLEGLYSGIPYGTGINFMEIQEAIDE